MAKSEPLPTMPRFGERARRLAPLLTIREDQPWPSRGGLSLKTGADSVEAARGHAEDGLCTAGSRGKGESHWNGRDKVHVRDVGVQLGGVAMELLVMRERSKHWQCI